MAHYNKGLLILILGSISTLLLASLFAPNAAVITSRPTAATASAPYLKAGDTLRSPDNPAPEPAVISAFCEEREDRGADPETAFYEANHPALFQLGLALPAKCNTAATLGAYNTRACHQPAVFLITHRIRI